MGGEADIELGVGEIGFMLVRLLKIRDAVQDELRFSTLSDEQGKTLRIKLAALNTVISILRGGQKGRFVDARLEVLVVSENEDGINGAYLCDEGQALILTEALLETEHLVTRYAVVPEGKEQITVYTPLRKNDV